MLNILKSVAMHSQPIANIDGKEITVSGRACNLPRFFEVASHPLTQGMDGVTQTLVYLDDSRDWAARPSIHSVDDPETAILASSDASKTPGAYGDVASAS